MARVNKRIAWAVGVALLVVLALDIVALVSGPRDEVDGIVSPTPTAAQVSPSPSPSPTVIAASPTPEPSPTEVVTSPAPSPTPPIAVTGPGLLAGVNWLGILPLAGGLGGLWAVGRRSRRP